MMSAGPVAQAVSPKLDFVQNSQMTNSARQRVHFFVQNEPLTFRMSVFGATCEKYPDTLKANRALSGATCTTIVGPKNWTTC